MADNDTLRTAPTDPVAAQWQLVREMKANHIDRALVEAAYANPVLRGLFPLVSHGSLQFSRCTGFPWSKDVPSIFPDHGGFRVIRLYEPGGQVIGSLTADAAVELVVSHLPADCGPAIDGTPDVLEPLS
ncbi:hypothetical protein F4556_003344 [Kitasatospora gansuensis]|uniref:Uncharacterized protein n=2 Tax=Kitasatospora TaxID=2063 RepID=A0A7W7SC88_9ACTN|nr:DUF6193 family natural product biosynthesis protein [Kitasatospora gansuensis]MBB4947809.1 hypothetical protein [Kitasatospora gansuensis]